MTRKVKLGWLPNQNYTPLTKSTFSENQAMAYKAGRAETFGQMGLDLLNEKLDESRFIAEEEWNPTYRYWREGLDWTPDMTEAGAKILAEVYDNDRNYDYVKERSTGITDLARRVTFGTTMMVLDEVNLIPFVGQFAKIGQGLKAGSMAAKILGPSKTWYGAVGKGAAQTTPFTVTESFLLYPDVERLRRQEDVSLARQFLNFSLGTAAGGALSGVGYGLRKALDNRKAKRELLNAEEIQTTVVKERTKTAEIEIKKTTDANKRTNAKIIEVDNLQRSDLSNDDLQNVKINNQVKKQSFNSDGTVTTDATARTYVTSTKTKVSISTTRSDLQRVLESIKDNVEVPAVEIKIRGSKMRGTFSKQDINNVDPVLEKLGVKRKDTTTKTKLLERNIDGETYGFTFNDKTGETIAYKKNVDGSYTAQSSENSARLLHLSQTKDPAIKTEIKKFINGENTVPPTKDVDVEQFDTRSAYKSQTPEEVADAQTGEAYRSIETVEQLDTLPEVLRIQKDYMTAVRNNQTKTKTTVYENGDPKEIDTDVSIIKTEYDKLKQQQELLKETEGKLDDFMVCNFTS